MDQARQRIEEDLRGLLDGDVLCDDVSLQLYASDASIYQITPLGVVRPRHTADVVACVRYALEHQITLHAHGAGTGLAAQSLGPGLLLDFSNYFRRILWMQGDTVRLQPGVVHERLNAWLRRLGRVFGPDPATSSVTTMGSVVALDGAGSRWLRYGSASRHVRSLQLVLADGSVIEAGKHPLVDGVCRDSDPRTCDLVNRLLELIRARAELIAARQPRSLVNRAGYHLDGLISDEWFDLARLIAGSEGTLGLITEMTLDTQLLPRHRNMAMLLFDRLDSAARAVPEILNFSPSSCDLLDRRHLGLALETNPRFGTLISPAAEAALIVEVDGDDPVEQRERLRQMVDRVRRRKRLAFDSRLAFSESEMELFWELARKVVPTLHRLKGNARPQPFVEDIAVPPAALSLFLVEMQNVLKRHEVTASLFGHAGHGQLHIRPFLDLGDPRQVQGMQQLASDLYDAVLAVGGTISGEHGDGLSRTGFLRRQYGELADVFAEVKNIFDPHNILNPGKIVASQSHWLTHHLRPVGVLAARQVPVPAVGNGEPANMPVPELVDLQLNWNTSEIEHEARRCNGCGLCRSQSPELRMCPIFRSAPAEEASPRAKANLMRAIFAGALEPGTLASDRFKEVADLCVNCHQCRLECPANVDVPRLMIEAKAAYVATNGLRLADWMLTHLDFFTAVGSMVSSFTNWGLANRQFRWLLEKTLGIAQRRKLPTIAKRSFQRIAVRKRWTRSTRAAGRKVAYFVDTYANYFDPELAEAVVAVMEHNGVSVYVHPAQRHSAMAMISIGALDQARQVANANVSALAEAVRQGYTVVSAEPSAVLCLTHEYPDLLSDDDTRLVAENTQDVCQYLWNLHTTGSLQLNFKPINAALGYHMPCHLKALQIGAPGLQLLRLIPGLSVQHVERGCSGMAGLWGLKRKNFRASLRAGWPLIATLREADWLAGTTECSTCKMQMEQGTPKPTIHPIKLMALSYGLMPHLASRLTRRSPELTVT